MSEDKTPISIPTWKHPTGKNPKEVHIVCAGYTQRDYLAAVGSYHCPVPTDCEVWSLNKALRGIKADFGFVLDDIVGEYNKDPKYISDLCRLDMPIITTTIDPNVANYLAEFESTAGACTWHEFPIHEIRDQLGLAFGELYAGHGKLNAQLVKQFGNGLMYFQNSLPMMLAYAWFIGVKTIWLWGADYDHPMIARREDDKPNAEFWVGFLMGQGIQVVLPKDTTLMGTRTGRPIYGYGARQPRL